MSLSPGTRGLTCRLVTTFCILLATALVATAQTSMQVKIYFESKSQFRDLIGRHLDAHNQGDDFIEAFINADELQQLQQDGFSTEIVYEDVVAHYQSRLETSRDMGGYMTLVELESRLDNLITFNPAIVSNKISIGQTIEGRDQWAVKISDNPNVDEDEPEILFTAAIHAREVITPEVLFYFMEHLTNNYAGDPDIQALVDSREIWFILCVNPDGYFRNQVIAPNGGGLWRKNRRNNGDGTYGVDLNRNYGYEWGYDNIGSSPSTSDETYRGPSPFSEPETQNMKAFIESHEFVITVYYHSYSNLVLYPWGYDRLITPDNNLFEVLSDSIVIWNNYAPSPGWGLYVTNGDSDDWGYGEQVTKNKNLAFTFEVGDSNDGFWPNLSRVATLVNENLEPNLFLTRAAGYVYDLAPPKAPVVTVDTTVDSAMYSVDWSHDDTLNPAIGYELEELAGLQKMVDPAENFDDWTNDGYAISTARTFSFPSSFHNVSGDNYTRTLTSTDQFVVSPGDSLIFMTWYDIETDWDYLYAAVSTDGSNFDPLEGNLTTTSNPHGNNPGYGITGNSSNQWLRATFDLSAYVGQAIYLRIGYNTDASVQEEGVYLDDIFPAVQWSSETIVVTDYVDTSYTFTDKTPGTYFYRVRAKDAQGQWSIFSSLVGTSVFGADPCIDGDGDGFGDPGIPGNNCPDDNCQFISNPGQEDADGDGIGDACDECTDLDGDGYGDPGFTLVSCALDNCPAIFNPDQADADGDGIGDLCDDCIDPDNDGFASPGFLNQTCALDNCPDVNNPGQEDADGDGIGDVCDPCTDIDGDGFASPGYTGQSCALDNCPDTANPGQEDTNNDGIGNACCCIGIRGNITADANQDIDISDLTQLVGYMFRSDSPPGCPLEADVNGDSPTSEPDIADLTALVGFMFKSGTTPANCP